MRTLQFCFDYISSNAYLAWLRLPELCERFELQLEPIPVLFAGLLEANGQLGPAEIRPKAHWMVRNTLRKAGILGVALRPPASHPFNPLLALRVSSLELQAEQREALISALFRATWSEGLAVYEPTVVSGILDGLGLDGSRLVSEATAPHVKQRLREATQDAIERDVFGVPSFEVAGELFWGYDDLPYLEGFLAGRDTIRAEDAACWTPGPPRPSSMRRRFREQEPPSWRRERERERE